MQAVQDLSVEDRVSRTQYQYSLEHPDPGAARSRGRRGCSRRCGTRRRCRTSPPTSRTAGCGRDLAIDRDTASRFGITAQNVDDTLYSAFGQRQVSTIFTQLNQYHVILELAAAAIGSGRTRSPTLYVPTADGRQVPLLALDEGHDHQRAADDQPPGAVPVGDAVVQPLARRVAGRSRAGGRGRDDAASGCRRVSVRDSRGRRRRSRRRSRTKAG